MNRIIRALSLVAVATVIGCGGDSAGSNALPAVQPGAPGAAKETGKTPEGKKAGTMGPQGADSLKAL